jgi:hypothetical protein
MPIRPSVAHSYKHLIILQRSPRCPQKLALTSPKNGGRSIRIVRLRTKATEYFYSFLVMNYVPRRRIATGSNIDLYILVPLVLLIFQDIKICSKTIKTRMSYRDIQHRFLNNFIFPVTKMKRYLNIL